MILPYLLIAVVLGFVQGFVGIATTVGLAKPFGALIAVDNRNEHAFSDAEQAPRIFQGIAIGLAFVALFVVHIVVIEVILVTLSAGSRTARAELGQVWIFSGLAGIAMVRLLPAIELRIRNMERER